MSTSSRPITTVGALSDPKPSLRRLGSVRWGLLVAALALVPIGIATIHSASAELLVDPAPRQLVWVGAGLLLMAIAMSIDYRVLMDTAALLYGVGVVALALILVFGHSAGGARSWLGIGSVGGQPSEFMKLATVLILARYLATINQRYLSLRQILVCGVLVGLPMLLIAIEPDKGTAMVYLSILAGMLLVAGVQPRALGLLSLAALVVGVLIWFFGMQDYQRQRILTYVSPGSDPLGAGYQVRQSKIAVGSGELLGRGYMQGTQSQLRFLPARHTDFIFAVLAEEWGFVGVAVVLGLYSFYIFNAARVARRARDRAGVLLVVGLVSVFAFHVLYNTAMMVGLVPITGIPLPFLSYGGSFTLINFIAAGLILGVDLRRHVNR